MRLAALLLVSLAGWFAAAAASEAPSRPAITEVAVLVDVAGSRGIADVRSDPGFTPLDDGLSAGFTDRVHWLRFTVQAPAPGAFWLLVRPGVLDDLRLYAPDPQDPERFREALGGDMQPFAERPLPMRDLVFPLRVADPRPTTFYLRVQTRSVSLVQLELLSPAELARRALWVEFAMGLYFGCLGLLLLQHLMQWLGRRETLSKWFALYLVAQVGLTLNMGGYVHQYLTPERPELAHSLQLISLGLMLPLAAPFYWRLLGVERSAPLLQSFYALVLCLPLVMAIVALQGYVALALGVTGVLGLIANITGLGITWRQMRGHAAGARYALCAYALALATIVATFLPGSGLSTSAWLFEHGYQFGALAVAVSFHLALVMRQRQQDVERTRALERADAAEREMQREMRERREQAQFIAMLSHELKTPLTMIDGALQSLQHLVEHTEGRRRLDRMRRAVRRIDRLVEQFLRADSLDAHAVRLQPQAFDMADLCARLRQESTLGERIVLRAPASLPVRADPALLRVAVANLIDNAAKYGGADGSIEVVASVSGGMAEIMVADRGPGVPRELVPRLFERYVRARDTGDIPGTGLGLHLVSRVAQLHGGEALYAARDGGGSIFGLRLPLEAA